VVDRPISRQPSEDVNSEPPDLLLASSTRAARRLHDVECSGEACAWTDLQPRLPIAFASPYSTRALAAVGRTARADRGEALAASMSDIATFLRERSNV
jgi:hypothetical protein